jgi:hypothetical protein
VGGVGGLLCVGLLAYFLVFRGRSGGVAAG